jgi:ankyrin repeat protein
LTYAVVYRRAKLVELLLCQRPEVEAPLHSAWSPLMYATHEGDARIVALLLKHGADTHRKDNFGRMALDLASPSRRAAIARALGSK